MLGLSLSSLIVAFTNRSIFLWRCSQFILNHPEGSTAKWLYSFLILYSPILIMARSISFSAPPSGHSFFNKLRKLRRFVLKYFIFRPNLRGKGVSLGQLFHEQMATCIYHIVLAMPIVKYLWRIVWLFKLIPPCIKPVSISSNLSAEST